MNIVLVPIKELLADNGEFMVNPDCQESLQMSVAFYASIGYHPPWIGYYAGINGSLVGMAGFKGKPIDGRVEIAYGTFPSFQNQGIGTAICQKLVQLAQETVPSVHIMARTLAEENYSTKILRKNGFAWQGNVIDKDDGEVWEWEYKEASKPTEGKEASARGGSPD
ncbi:MAG: GNAT family N-acetyltransferase [Cyclobacteriaceae bacterium]|nr:GNAT family N-acetyltransferase [Cyclobacteriaceae bacterium]MDH4294968.1 GNAT family N-acetyltransferase [Cyclobacteriaceae bacterium]MDH5249006.1 GNAT family N-acetyltransferase [Cyclobacteriaceae bacterium]